MKAKDVVVWTITIAAIVWAYSSTINDVMNGRSEWAVSLDDDD